MFLRLGVTVAAIAATMMAQETALDHFEKKIRPVLASRCYTCHSSAAKPVQGGLRLDSAAGIGQGGSSGAAIRAGDPERSLLFARSGTPTRTSRCLPASRWPRRR